MLLKNSWKWLVALAAVFVPASLTAAVTIPNTFTSGTPIVAAEMNANFSALKTFVDGLEATINGKADAPATGSYVNTPQGRVAWAWITAACSTSTSANCTLNPDFVYNPGGAAPTSTRTGAGRYTVDFPGLNPSAAMGNVQVTSYGDTTNICKVVSWNAASVTVRCFDTSGTNVDSRFTVLVSL